MAVVVGPEVISGSTRMKAGTAQKLLLNTISTVTMVRLGKTYGNLMVDVVASNAKLRNRARSAVVIATGARRREVDAALEASGDVEGGDRLAARRSRRRGRAGEARSGRRGRAPGARGGPR